MQRKHVGIHSHGAGGVSGWKITQRNHQGCGRRREFGEPDAAAFSPQADVGLCPAGGGIPLDTQMGRFPLDQLSRTLAVTGQRRDGYRGPKVEG